MKVYIAGGWFTPRQAVCLSDIVEACKAACVDVFNPKEELMYDPKKGNEGDIFYKNFSNLKKCTAVIASTEGKDMGTLFECGYAYGKGMPVIYYFPSNDVFNLMLSESARAVITTRERLFEYVQSCSIQGMWKPIIYRGHIQ